MTKVSVPGGEPFIPTPVDYPDINPETNPADSSTLVTTSETSVLYSNPKLYNNVNIMNIALLLQLSSSSRYAYHKFMPMSDLYSESNVF